MSSVPSRTSSMRTARRRATRTSKGEKVRVSGIGQFEVVEHPAREVYSPSKGEKIHVEASRKTKVKPAKEIREF